MTNVPFWDNVVNNASAIIGSLTAMLATLGGLWLQSRSTRKQFKEQNQKIDKNAVDAKIDRAEIAAKVETVHSVITKPPDV